MPVNNELPWIGYARKQIGLREVKGAKHNPKIIQWLKNLKSAWLDDETPWCGTFVAECLREADLVYPSTWYRAKDYLNLPVKLNRPAYGCIAVFWRKGGFHVGFVVGIDKYGNLMILGGNQGDMVSIKPFSLDRLVGLRWASKYPLAERFNLPLLLSDGRVSENEA